MVGQRELVRVEDVGGDGACLFASLATLYVRLAGEERHDTGVIASAMRNFVAEEVQNRDKNTF